METEGNTGREFFTKRVKSGTKQEKKKKKKVRGGKLERETGKQMGGEGGGRNWDDEKQKQLVFGVVA